MADRIVVLKEGAIEQVGPPLELYRAPRTEFVAGFLGSPGMNFVDVRVQGGLMMLDDVVLGESGVDVANLRLGIRPEHIDVAPAGQGRLDVVVDVKETLGGEAYLYTRHESSGTQFVVKTDGEDPHEVEERVALAFSSDRLHLFSNDGSAVAKDSHA